MKKIILLLIVILAISLRFIGAAPGYPPYHSDEGISYSAAVEMIKHNDLDPLRYDYPAVVPLSNFISFKLLFMPFHWAKFYLTNLGNILDGFLRIPLDEHTYKRVFQLQILGEREVNALFWGRYVTATFGIGIVLLTYLIGRKLFDWKTGILAALLVCVNYRQVLNSHLGLPDIYNAFFLLLAFLMSLHVLEKPTRKTYLLAGIAAGLSFATKYQFFSFAPLLITHLYLTFQKDGIKEKIKFLFKPEALLIPVTIAFVFIALNPYMFIKIEETIAWMSSVSGKYRVGLRKLDLYSIAYLYHIGIGPITSLLVLLGIVIALVRYLKKSILLLSVVVSFLYITIYYTGGGYYTRNFVTIIPFFLLFAGIALATIFDFFKRVKVIGLIVVLLFVSFVTYENLRNSVVVPQEYSKQWNYKIVEKWVTENIPQGSRVAAHSSVVIPPGHVERLPYDFDPAFSIEEFKELNADYAIANLDWATSDFYWWMTVGSGNFKYWNKPVDELSRTYPALTIKELSSFAIYSEINAWQAPESNFIVAKIPKYEVSNKEKVASFNNLSKGWKSDPIEVSDWEGFYMDFDLKVESVDGLKRDGYVYIKFYDNVDDAKKDVNEVLVRLSGRTKVFSQSIKNSLSGTVPKEAKYAVVGSHVYIKESNQLEIDLLELYKAQVKADFDENSIRKLQLDHNVLFPNSHGYL